MENPSWPAPPRNPAQAPPTRRPGSVRRTSTILMHWPGGRDTQLRLEGRARDLATPVDGPPTVVAEASMDVGVGSDRTIDDITTSRVEVDLTTLVGARGGGRLRAAVDAAFPGEREAGTPLYLLLDDIAGCSLIAGFAWSRWTPQWREGPTEAGTDAGDALAALHSRMEGICSGFRPGASAFSPDGMQHNTAPVPPLADPADPLSWHIVPDAPAVAMRRARRVDIWATVDGVAIDAMFRDTCWEPDGTEVAVHEYSLAGVADPATWTLASLQATPRVLPFAECPGAATNASRMVGRPLAGFRSSVLDVLQSTDCCTHLNDALRALAELPVLAGSLPSPHVPGPPGA